MIARPDGNCQAKSYKLSSGLFEERALILHSGSKPIPSWPACALLAQEGISASWGLAGATALREGKPKRFVLTFHSLCQLLSNGERPSSDGRQSMGLGIPLEVPMQNLRELTPGLEGAGRACVNEERVRWADWSWEGDPSACLAGDGLGTKSCH